MLIDFHTHAFPNKISQKAMETLAYASGGLKPQSEGTGLSLKQEMEKDGVDVSVVSELSSLDSVTVLLFSTDVVSLDSVSGTDSGIDVTGFSVTAVKGGTDDVCPSSSLMTL